MEQPDQLREVNRAREVFTRWPRSVVVCFLSSTVGLIMLEIECVDNLRSILKSHISLRHPWFYPALIFALWAWSVWNLWKVSSTHDRIDSGVTRLMEYIACIPVFSYILAWQWGEMILAVSKIR